MYSTPDIGNHLWMYEVRAGTALLFSLIHREDDLINRDVVVVAVSCELILGRVSDVRDIFLYACVDLVEPLSIESVCGDVGTSDVYVFKSLCNFGVLKVKFAILSFKWLNRCRFRAF